MRPAPSCFRVTNGHGDHSLVDMWLILLVPGSSGNPVNKHEQCYLVSAGP
jgi:hypothetical protein